jgi:hypothetical protein
LNSVCGNDFSLAAITSVKRQIFTSHPHPRMKQEPRKQQQSQAPQGKRQTQQPDEYVSVASFNIGRDNAVIIDNWPHFNALLGWNDILCLQECPWDTKDERRNFLEGSGYVLLANSRGSEEPSEEKSEACLEIYLKRSRLTEMLPGVREEWRSGSIAHGLTLNPARLDRRREFALGAELEILGRRVWVVNVHLPAEFNSAAFTCSNDWRWKYCLPELDRWYADKEVIFAGDWNFDLFAAFAPADTVGTYRRPFTIKPEHCLPLVANGMRFPDSVSFEDINEITYSNKAKGIDARVDFVSYHAPSPQRAQLGNPLIFTKYEVYHLSMSARSLCHDHYVVQSAFLRQ